MAFWKAFIKPAVIDKNTEFLSESLYLAEDIRYHLEKLVAAQPPLQKVLDKYRLAKSSLLCFGIENCIRVDEEKFALIKTLENQIQHFEKRLQDIKVYITSHENSLIKLEITARVKEKSLYKEVSFSTRLGLNDILKENLDGSLND